MRFLVLGSGMQGRGCAFDMLREPAVKEVVLADGSSKALAECRRFLRSRRVKTRRVDASDTRAVFELARNADVLVSAVPYFLNFGLAEAAIAAKAHFLDLGGNTEIVRKELSLNSRAKKAGVCVQPDVGVAPGMVNIIGAYGIALMDRADEVLLKVGGLPEKPVPPMNYQLTFSEHGLINEYVENATALRGGRRVKVPGLSELEALTFPTLGRCEAAHAAGGLATMAYTFAGKVRSMEYKVIRYPGHCVVIDGMKAMGFFSRERMRVGGADVEPRALSAALFRRHFHRPGARDLIVFRATVRGRKGRKRVEYNCDMVDRYDPKTRLSAMMRTTGFPASIVAQMMAKGMMKPGAYPVEVGVPQKAFITECRKRGFKLRESFR